MTDFPNLPFDKPTSPLELKNSITIDTPEPRLSDSSSRNNLFLTNKGKENRVLVTPPPDTYRETTKNNPFKDILRYAIDNNSETTTVEGKNDDEIEEDDEE